MNVYMVIGFEIGFKVLSPTLKVANICSSLIINYIPYW